MNKPVALRWFGLGGAVALVLALIGLAACQVPVEEAPPTPVADATRPPSPGGGELLTPAPVDTAAPTPAAPAVITLTLWTTETFSPTQAITSGQVLAGQADAFLASHPDIRLDVVLKKPYGRGGILDFLLNTGKVVPHLLPDLVWIDTAELGSAAQAGLLQPLDSVLPPELTGDLFPFARQAGSLDGKLYGVQLYANLEHLLYNIGKLQAPPRSWITALSLSDLYIFPAGGNGGLVNDAFWIQYLALPPPEPKEGVVPLLDAERLTRVFQFYADGLEQGVIPPAVADYHTADDCWPVYLNGQAAMTHVTVRRYLADRHLLRFSAFAPIPTSTGRAMAISQGWALALVADDPARQQAAARLIEWLADPANSAAWTWAARSLPTRRAALALWGDDSTYRSFIEQQLEVARPRPAVTDYTRVATILQQAVQDVVKGTATPEQAANRVISTLQSR